MRKAIVGLVAAALLALGAGSAAAHGPPPHWHCLQTPNGQWHLIGRGLTEDAAHQAFDNFHFKVHRGVFGVTGTGLFDVEGKHPLGPVLFVLVPACP